MVDLEHGEKVAKRVALAVAGLAAVKGVVGAITNSAALLADALHSITDVLTAAGAWIGLKIARRPANERFPYGYYRAESIVAFVISAAILWSAVELFLEGVERIQNPQPVEKPWLAAGTALLAAVFSYYISRVESRAAEASNSGALKAVSAESLADCLSSLVVFLAVLAGAYFNVPWTEGASTVVIAAWVLKIGLESAWNAVLSLMDVAPAETRKKVESILEGLDETVSYRELRLRKAGPMVFGEVTVTVPFDIPVAKANDIARQIREKVLEIPEIVDFRVYVEQEEPEEKTVVVPVDSGTVSKSFARAPEFAVYTVRNGTVEKIKTVRNTAAEREVRRGLLAAKNVLREKPYAVIVRNIGEISYNTLKNELVRIYLADGDDPCEEVRKFAEKRLPELHRPTVERE